MIDPALAQRGGADWMTVGGDAQRTGWVRADGKINPNTMAKPGFDLVWTLQPKVQARGLNSLLSPSLIEFYIGYKGFRSLGFFGTSSDSVVGVDIDLGNVEWEKSFSSGASTSNAGSIDCPGGMTAAVTRPTGTAYPSSIVGRGFGRGTPAKSAVSEPHEGAVTLRPPSNPRPAPPKPAAPKPAAGASAADNPFAPRVQYAVALAADGALHPMWISNGHEASAAIPFLPAGANAAGLISTGGFTYASTFAGCNGVDSGVWAIDMVSKKVNTWKAPAKGGVVGTAGQAHGPDGSAVVATASGELFVLAPKTLEPKGSYKSGGSPFTSSPVIFEFKGKNLAAATTADGRLHLIDIDSPKKAVAKSEVFSGPNYATGALATWRDVAGVRWILAPAGPTSSDPGAIVALKIVEKGKDLTLQKVWTSREMISPAAPIVVNGVVFALSTGESRNGTLQERISASQPAILYAMDGLTGAVLWNSGKTMKSFVHSGGLASGGSRVYTATYDGTQYVFSFPMEH